MFYFDENNDVVYITDGKKIVYRRYKAQEEYELDD